MFALHLFFAGAWAFIWHWGLGIGLIVLLLGAAYFSNLIPLIGPWLGKQRLWLEIAAVGIALVLVGVVIGTHDEANRCQAKAVVIEKIVKKAVTDTELPQAEKAKDPWDTDQ